MNEQIQKLAIEAKLSPALLLRHWGNVDALTDSERKGLEQLEKFAELIVRECFKAAMIESKGHMNPIDLMKRMKERVGVEE